MKTSVDAVERGCALHAHAQQLREGGDPIGARRLCERALRLLTGALGPRHPDVANVLLELAGTYHDRSDCGRAQDLCVRALQSLGRRRCGKDGDRLRFAALALHADLLVAAGRYREARRVWRRTLGLAERALGAAERRAAHNGLGVVCKHLGCLDEAEGHYRVALRSARRARAALELATLYHNLGGLDHARGRFVRGAATARRGLRLREAALGSAHTAVAADKAALASLLEGNDDLEGAEALYREAIRVFRRAYGRTHFEVGLNLGNLAAVAHRRGDLATAGRRYGRALAIQERAAGPAHPLLALLVENFATLRLEQGRQAEAASLYRRAAAIYARTLGPRHPDTLMALRHWRAITKAGAVISAERSTRSRRSDP